MKKIIALATLIAIVSCDKKEFSRRVQSEKVVRKTIIEKVEGIGKIKPELEVKISSDVAGRIVELNGKPGDPVKKGDVLIRIDEKTYKESHARAVSSLNIAKANLSKYNSELKRVKELAVKNLISAAEIEVAEANYKVQKAQLEQSEASLREATENLRKCTVRSPINGIITVKNKEQGEIAQGSSFNLDVLMIIADLSKMETVVEIPEAEIIKVELGQKCDLEVDAFPGKTFEGIVTEIANSAQESIGSQESATNFEVKISIIDKEQRFRPGMNVTSYVKTKFVENAIVVPIQAVTARFNEPLEEKKDDESTSKEESERKNESLSDKKRRLKNERKMNEVVFVVKEDKTVEQRTIVKGISDDDYYRIISGVAEGEEVVVGPYKLLSTNLKNGDNVKVDNEWFERKRDTKKD